MSASAEDSPRLRLCAEATLLVMASDRVDGLECVS